MSVRSWTMELKEELYNTGLAFVWRKQQDRNMRELKILKDRCSDIEGKIFLQNFQRRAH